MRNLFIAIVLLAGCSRDNEQAGNDDLLLNKSWKTYSYSRNGVSDPYVVVQQPTFQFRTDGKLYFSQINPVYRDTLNFSFINDNNIKLTKPWISSAYIGNIKIDRLTEYDFDFTATDNQAPNTGTYKTTKQ
jgi:hypothetical protein